MLGTRNHFGAPKPHRKGTRSVASLVDLSKTDSAVDGVDRNAYTFSMALGPKSASGARSNSIAFSGSGSAGFTIASVTIGGVNAPVAVYSANGSTGCGITDMIDTSALADTVNVVITVAAAAVIARCGATCYRSTRHTTAAPTKTGTASRTSTPGTMTPTLVAPDVGFQIGVAFSAGGTNRRHSSAHSRGTANPSFTVDCQDDSTSWINASEDTDTSMEAGIAALMSSAIAGWKYP